MLAGVINKKQQPGKIKNYEQQTIIIPVVFLMMMSTGYAKAYDFKTFGLETAIYKNDNSVQWQVLVYI